MKPKIIRQDGDYIYKRFGKFTLTISKTIKFPGDPLVYFDLQGSDIILEDNVALSSGIYIYTHTHYFKKEKWREMRIIKNASPTILKKDCFLGTNVIIIHSCKYIGISSVIAAGSVVTKNIPDYEIWAGNPAKKIGEVEHECIS